jgi:hypothetical protein
MTKVTIRYGVDVIEKSYTYSPTVGDILADDNIQAVLGYGDNIRGLIAGVEQPASASVYDGATLVIETKANEKHS